MEKFFQGVKEGELGIWVVISGWFDAAKACCQKVGDKLPPKDVLEINTMCKHGRGAANLVTFLAGGHQAGRVALKDAAQELFKQGCGGVINPMRGAELL